MIDNKKLLTITEASELLKVSKTSLRRWSNEGRIQCYRVGARKERRFDLNDLRNMVTSSVDLSNTPERGEISNSEPGKRSHICTFYKNPRMQWQLLRQHLIQHMSEGSRAIYLYHGDRDRVVNWISLEKLNVEDLIKSGRLILMSSSESYYRGGYFNTDKMLEFWKDQFDAAKVAGIDKLMLTGEMGWADISIPGYEQLNAYEEALDHMLELYPWVTAVCQYPVYQFSGIAVFDNLCVHSHVQLENRLVSCFSDHASS